MSHFSPSPHHCPYLLLLLPSHSTNYKSLSKNYNAIYYHSLLSFFSRPFPYNNKRNYKIPHSLLSFSSPNEDGDHGEDFSRCPTPYSTHSNSMQNNNTGVRPEIHRPNPAPTSPPPSTSLPFARVVLFHCPNITTSSSSPPLPPVTECPPLNVLTFYLSSCLDFHSTPAFSAPPVSTSLYIDLFTPADPNVVAC